MRLTNYQSYATLLLYARKVSRCDNDAEDLLQTVLLAALKANRSDVSCSENRRWLFGALRKRALFDARSAVRRRRREVSINSTSLPADNNVLPTNFLDSLPKGLRVMALLVLTGHTKTEISWLLRTSDAALRQRIVQIKKRWRAFDGHHISELQHLTGELAFGQIRKALLKLSRQNDVILASHDPDGHLFVLTKQPFTATLKGNTS